MSIVFTWDLPAAKAELNQYSFDWDKAIVGGPAVNLMSDYFKGMEHVTVGYDLPGILQKINPMATRTTTGCIRKCGFCAVGAIEGNFQELENWPDLPLICDNNILAATEKHLNKVFDRLEKHEWCEFNQGIDIRLLNEYHVERIARLNKVMCRFSLDSMKQSKKWEEAFELLRKARIPKNRLRSYALIGFNTGPEEAWSRCEWIKKFGIDPLPMWFHSLKQFKRNIVTEKQEELGWDDFERRKIMGWYYKRKILKRKGWQTNSNTNQKI